MKFSVKYFFSKCDQIRKYFLPIWSHLLTKFSMENFSFCAVGPIKARLLSLNIPMISEC